MAPIKDCARLLTTMPGVSEVTAHVIVAEIGVDMARFPTQAHLLSWATLCPRNDESAGKRRSTRVRKGATWLKTALVTAAWAAVRVKGSYLQAQFLRLKARRGAKKAIIAVAASMLTAAYHMLKNGLEYRDLGAQHFTPPRSLQSHLAARPQTQRLGLSSPTHRTGGMNRSSDEELHTSYLR